MSLLLDALKKAEEAKRQSTGGREGGAPAAGTPASQGASPAELSLEPHPQPATSPLPDLSAHLETVNADLAAVSISEPLRKPAPPAARPLPPADDAEREAVRNVFAAKTSATPDRKPLWIALGATAIALIGIGGWFWWQMQAVGTSSLAARPAGVTTPPMPAPVTQPASLPHLPAQPSPQPAPIEQAASSATTASPAPIEQPPRQASAVIPAEPEGPVRITRSTLRINPALAQAYEQFQAGQLEAAERSYTQALRSDPNNSDALLGMAAIALQQGQNAKAEAYYIKALEADPKDAAAQAGLVNLRGQSDPATAESRLKGMLAAQPESAALNFALGNLYAGQARWPEAQQAYFRAHTADAGNPDYLFNLAASLDHLHLPKIALQYYQEALTAAASRRTGFDVNQVKARIIELQQP